MNKDDEEHNKEGKRDTNTRTGRATDFRKANRALQMDGSTLTSAVGPFRILYRVSHVFLRKKRHGARSHTLSTRCAVDSLGYA